MSTTLLSRFGSGMMLALVACALPTKHTGLDNAGGRVSTVGTQTRARRRRRRRRRRDNDCSLVGSARPGFPSECT